MQTMQQQRARYALEQVEVAKSDNTIPQKEYKSYAASFPAMIRMSGLGQAAAFYRSKGIDNKPKDKAYKALYDLLSGWLIRPGQPYATHDDLLKGITSQDMHDYRVAQVEALLLLDWVKKFAKAYMEGD